MAYDITTDTVEPTDWWRDTYNNPYPGAGFGATYNDPWTGSNVTRLTEAAGSAGDEHYCLEYPSQQHFNSANTWIRVGNGVTQASKVIDIATGATLRTLPTASGLLARWPSATDPDLMYYNSGNTDKKLKSIVISTGTVATIADLGAYTPTLRGSPIVKMSVGEQGLAAGNIVSVGCNAAADQVNLAVDLDTGRVISELYRSDVGANFFDATVSACGLYWKVAVIGGGEFHWECWDMNSTGSGDAGVATERWDGSTFLNGASHNAVAVAPDGRSYMFAFNNPVNNDLYRYDMEAGTAVKLYNIGWFNPAHPAAPDGFDEYLSGHSCATDGYIYMTVWPGGQDGDPSLGWEPNILELVRFPWDGGLQGGGPIERILHHRCNPKYPIVEQNQYWAMPKLAVSADGTKVAWTANYRRPSAGGVVVMNSDVYIHTIQDTPFSSLDASGAIACAATKTGRGTAALTGRGSIQGQGGSTTSTPADKFSGRSSMGKTGAFV